MRKNIRYLAEERGGEDGYLEREEGIRPKKEREVKGKKEEEK